VKLIEKLKGLQKQEQAKITEFVENNGFCNEVEFYEAYLLLSMYGPNFKNSNDPVTDYIYFVNTDLEDMAYGYYPRFEWSDDMTKVFFNDPIKLDRLAHWVHTYYPEVREKAIIKLSDKLRPGNMVFVHPDEGYEWWWKRDIDKPIPVDKIRKELGMSDVAMFSRLTWLYNHEMREYCDSCETYELHVYCLNEESEKIAQQKLESMGWVRIDED
jgi:hypothetical protein